MSDFNRNGDQYPEFGASIKERFSAVVGNGLPLFTTDADGLFDIFLANLPAEARQHYTCNACKHFVHRYGGLVYIADSGVATPAIWDEAAVPKFFRDSVKLMKKAVAKAKVTGVFLSGNAVLGHPVTGSWEHMSVALPRRMVFASRLKTAGQAMAEKREDYRIVNSAIQEYRLTVVNQAITLLKSESLYRSDKVLGVAEWFGTLLAKLESAQNSQIKANIKWLAVATAPTGFCHVKSSMIGTLLDDIKDGMELGALTRRFKEKMDPFHYLLPQAAPTQGNIEQAEKIVEKLGIANSLKRRFAKFEEIPHFLWRIAPKVEAPQSGGVFSHLAPKGVSEPEVMNLPSATMTWEKFRRTVLPEAETIEARINNPSACMALITASDPDAPNILRWDNSFSWYFRPGSSYSNWRVPLNGFAKVTGIVNSPNQWGESPRPEHKIFLLLEGCRDVSGLPGGGIFPELLKSELHEVRSTLEAYSAKAVIEDVDNASACGVGYSKNNQWDLTLKVTSNNSTRLIKIDRWD